MENNKKMDYSKVNMIKASAGSGKTHTLAQRLAESIENGIEPDKFLVTTFTCNAAAELCERIYRELLKSKGPQIADAFLDSMVNTVHSICATLLNDHCISAGLSPSLRPIPEKLTKMIVDRAIADILDLDEEKTELLERLSLKEDWKGYLNGIIEKARFNGIDSDVLEGSDVLSQNAEQNIREIRTFFEGTASVDLKAIVQEYKDVLRNVQRESLTDGGKKLFDRISGFVRFPSWYGLIGLTKQVGDNLFGEKDDPRNRAETSTLVTAHKQILEKFFPTDQTKLTEYHERAKEICPSTRDRIKSLPKSKKTPKAVEANLQILEEFANAKVPDRLCLVRFARSSFGNCKEGNYPELIGFHKEIQTILSERSLRVINSKELLADLEEIIRFLFKLAADAIKAFATYKEQFGLIDFDDLEARVRDLIGEPSFLEDLSERVHQFMVDEFQDTSPIQLELMNGFHQAIHKIEGREKTIWVGDPKQAIYSFRGADSTLMQETIKKVPNDEKHTETLKYSYRSKKELVELSNRIFSHVFDDRNVDDIRLEIPEKRKGNSSGGKISSWLLVANTQHPRNITYARALVSGITDLIKQEGYKRSDIAVLCRTGTDCNAVSSALAERNIPSTNSSGKLLDTFECQLVLAAYQYALDKRNLLAATRYVVLSGEKKITELFGSLLEKRQKGESLQETFEFLEERFSRIGNRKGVTDLTPVELLDRVIQTLNIDRLIDRMKFPEARRCNLDALRQAASGYLQTASVGGLSPSPAGFLAWIQGADLDAAAAVGENLVKVMTYHLAKGLEWPVVILYSLNWTKPLCERIFQTRALSADRFLPESPLEGRSIHCWPYPFGRNYKNKTLNSVDELNKLLDSAIDGGNEESRVKELNDLDTLDAKNLFYVGVTRAEDHVIFAMRAKTETKNGNRTIKEGNTNWINNILSSPGIFNWSTVEGETNDNDGWLPKTGFTPEGEKWEPVTEDLTLETKIFSADDSIDTAVTPKPIFLDPLPQEPEPTFYPAKLDPSDAKISLSKMEKDNQPTPVYGYVSQLPNLTNLEPITDKDGLDQRFGKAFHQYIELHPTTNRRDIATQCLREWGCPEGYAKALDCQEEALYKWIQKRWPKGQILCEVPITLANPEGPGQYQGVIDMLIETDEGYVIIDHKTHRAETDQKAQESAAKDKYKKQLKVYRAAVQNATGKKVIGTFIHLPMCGKIYELTLD